MLDVDVQLINEEFFAEKVTPARMDDLWREGWRHFGSYFFRYSHAFYGPDVRAVIPLRIRLNSFSFSRSQKRVLERNADLETVIAPLAISAESEELFDRHKSRFSENIPESIYNFVPPNASGSPANTFQLSVREKGKLVAESYFDAGQRAVSGIYATFEPELKNRSLGIFTLLREIGHAIDQGMEYYYLGYSYEGSSFYDYKKRFRATEAFDWQGRWREFDASNVLIDRSPE